MDNPTVSLQTLERLYETYYPRIYKRAYCLLGCVEDAKEVTQDTFFKAFRALEKSLSTLTENPYPWLYRIVTNTAYDVLRQRRRYVSCQSLDENALSVEQHISDPQEDYPTQEHVRCTLAHLPKVYQRLLVMKFLEGSTEKEIAHALGLTGGAAHYHLSRARRAFREAYAREVQV